MGSTDSSGKQNSSREQTYGMYRIGCSSGCCHRCRCGSETFILTLFRSWSDWGGVRCCHRRRCCGRCWRVCWGKLASEFGSDGAGEYWKGYFVVQESCD